MLAERLPQVSLADREGVARGFDYWSGKSLIVNFWATWCAPCRVEIPGFIDLYRRYRSRGVEMIGIAADEPPDVVRPYAREMKISYPVLIGRERSDVLDAFGGPLLGMPTTVIVNRDGTLCRRYVGFQKKQTFEDALKRLRRAKERFLATPVSPGRSPRLQHVLGCDAHQRIAEEMARFL